MIKRVVKLTDVCDFQGGTQPPKSVWKKDFEEGYIRMLHIRDFTQPEKDNVEYIPLKNTLKTCEELDILIGRYGASIGKICTGLAGAYNVALVKTKPDLEKVNRDFLLHLLKGGSFQNFILNIGGRAAQAGFNKGDLENFHFTLPPLDQQKKIAAILDAADTYRQKSKALITKYDELTQSLFLDMFGNPVANPKGWETKSFEEMVKFDTKMTKDFNKYGDLPHVGIRNIEKNTGKISGCISANEEGLTSGKYLFDNRHIIYSKIRPNLNKVALPNFEGLCSADSYPLLPIEGRANRIFIAFLLRSDSFVDFILQHSTRTNIPKANRAQMKLYRGIAPSIKLQNQFAERVQAIEAQKEQAQASLVQAENLFNSLLQRAFKGELV